MESEAHIHPLERHGRTIAVRGPYTPPDQRWPLGVRVLAVVCFGFAAWVGLALMIAFVRLGYAL